MTHLLEGRDLRLSFGTTEVLKGVSFHVDPGEMVAVMGPSGSGKSTLLHVLAGLLSPGGGEVYLRGDRIDRQSEGARSALRLRHMGFVFQFGDLVPELTVGENVELPLRLLGTRRKEARSRAHEVLDRLGIAGLHGHRLNQVSGGEAQRAAVARALVHRPPLLFADEPTGSLDTLAGEAVMEALAGAAHDGTAVVLVTHDAGVASWAHRDIVLRDGLITDPLAVR